MYEWRNLCIVIGVIAGCAANDDEPLASAGASQVAARADPFLDLLAERCQEAINLTAINGGATVTLGDGDMGGTNYYAVAMSSPEGVSYFVDLPTLDECMFWAMWNIGWLVEDGYAIGTDWSSGQVEFAVTALFPLEDYFLANCFGVEHQQDSMFNLSTFETIAIEYETNWCDTETETQTTAP